MPVFVEKLETQYVMENHGKEIRIILSLFLGGVENPKVAALYKDFFLSIEVHNLESLNSDKLLELSQRMFEIEEAEKYSTKWNVKFSSHEEKQKYDKIMDQLNPIEDV